MYSCHDSTWRPWGYQLFPTVKESTVTSLYDEILTCVTKSTLLGFQQLQFISLLQVFVNVGKWLLASSYPSVHPSVHPHGITRSAMDGFSKNMIFEDFLKIWGEYPICTDTNKGTLHAEQLKFMIISRSIIFF
jgi:hypothetical protein